MSEGWICLHRGWRDNPLFKGEYSRADAWVWLIENACWKASRSRIKGEAVELQRGELTFSQRFLADKWGWSKSRVDRFIADLRDEGMIETRSKNGATAGHSAGQGQSIITICNYAKYQDVSEVERGNAESKNGATAGQQRGKEEQGNKFSGRESGASASNAKAKPAKPKRIPADELPLPEGWEPILTPAAQAMVDGWPPGMLAREVMAFEGHARSNDRTTKDWQAAFRTWIAKAEDRRATTNGSNRNSAGASNVRAFSKPKDGAIAALDRRLGLEGGSGSDPSYDAGPGEADRVRAATGPRRLFS
ncbi:hypothetical protein [Novosphingobium sp. M1R2S20]|uniref:DnaT DNA-binding domain-containing protein n=1 Tax=Novosphingobium rhizovicinum TaxID=3228928 RepID=A0ABV3RDJ0_9SPHN